MDYESASLRPPTVQRPPQTRSRKRPLRKLRSKAGSPASPPSCPGEGFFFLSIIFCFPHFLLSVYFSISFFVFSFSWSLPTSSISVLSFFCLCFSLLFSSALPSHPFIDFLTFPHFLFLIPLFFFFLSFHSFFSFVCLLGSN